jgi:very-short-patch-repair endonuclease
MNVKYIKQKRFNDCRNKLPLPFDFYLPDINTCIEYDGEQHFKEVNIFGGVDRFKNQRTNDNIKNIYCQEKNINLIRIPYWEILNIESVLKNKIEYGII